ncbi:Proline rich 5 like [Chamberlinius hualienensis]
MDPEDGTSPHLRFSQRYKSGNAKSRNQQQQKQQPTSLSGVNKNANAEGKTVRTDVSNNKNIRSVQAFPPTYRNLYTTSSLQDYLKSQDNSDWESVQSTILKVFQRKSLGVRQLHSLRENVKNLWSTSGIGPILFEFYLKQVLTAGVAEIRNRLINLDDEELIRSTENNWCYFYSEVVPTLQAIFFPLNPKHTTLRHAILVCFRDNVILKINLNEALESVGLPTIGIKHMLLILQCRAYMTRIHLVKITWPWKG